MGHRIRLPRWAVERGRTLNDFRSLEPDATALVVIDMQNAFVAEGEVFGNAHARDIVPAVNRMIRAFRQAGAPVIWTRQTIVPSPPLAPEDWHYDASQPETARALEALASGSLGHALYPALDVAPADIVIDKHRYGAFSCPARALPLALERLGARMIVLCGTLTNVCCESTAREAYMAGFKVIAVADGMAAATDAEHNAALLNLRLNFADVRRSRELLAMIGRVETGA